MTYGERIKQLRKARGMSAEDLAEATGISPATIYRYENGSTEEPKASMLRKIANALETELSTSLPLGPRIMNARMALNLTQTDLADMLDVSRSAIGMWETGEREPSLETIERLARALHTSPAYLVGWTDSTTDPTQGGTPMTNKITLNALLTLTNAWKLRLIVPVTPRLQATVEADLNNAAELDDVSGLYGDREVTSVDTDRVNCCLIVEIR